MRTRREIATSEMAFYLVSAVGALLGGPQVSLRRVAQNRLAVHMVQSDAEKVAVEQLVAACSKLTRLGIDDKDKQEWERINYYVAALDDDV